MDLSNKKVFIILSKEVTDDDILKAYFHACVYALVMSKIKRIPAVSLIIVDEEFILASF